MKTIGFFGDSFCAVVENEHSKKHKYNTYIKMLQEDLNLEIVNLGEGGVSVWDVYLKQFKPLIDNNIPDICVFCWPGWARIYHREIRGICIGNVVNMKKSFKNLVNMNVWKAAHDYFQYLHDYEKESSEFLHLLYYLDNEVFPKLENKKIIHLWFEKDIDLNFKTGIEIHPSLMKLSNANSNKQLFKDDRPNHIEGTEKNKILFDVIKEAIKTDKNGISLNFRIDNES